MKSDVVVEQDNFALPCLFQSHTLRRWALAEPFVDHSVYFRHFPMYHAFPVPSNVDRGLFMSSGVGSSETRRCLADQFAISKRLWSMV